MLKIERNAWFQVAAVCTVSAVLLACERGHGLAPGALDDLPFETTPIDAKNVGVSAEPADAVACAGPAGPQCDACEPLIEQVELDSTPRDNLEAEAVAANALSDIFGNAAGPSSAIDDLYVRVVDELFAIRESYPELLGVVYHPIPKPQALLLEVDNATKAAIIDGTYSDWDCPNSIYGVIDFESPHSSSPFIRIYFQKIYTDAGIERLAQDYKSLPGVLDVHMVGALSQETHVCLAVDEQIHYLRFFAQGWEFNQRWVFSIDESMAITLLGACDDCRGDEQPWEVSTPQCI